jgi:hypothetical protein
MQTELFAKNSCPLMRYLEFLGTLLPFLFKEIFRRMLSFHRVSVPDTTR